MQWELQVTDFNVWLTANTEQIIFWLNYESWHSILVYAKSIRAAD